MVKYYDSIPENLQRWILSQPVFFTASAPLTGRHINISPKGRPNSSLSILNPNLVAYVDATGSGVETISHIYENGRVTVMFCSFAAAPQILRLFCTGRVIEWDQPGFEPTVARILSKGQKRVEAARAIIMLDVFKVQTSCGFGVPYLALKAGDEHAGDAGDAEKEAEAEAGNLKPYLEDRMTLGHWGAARVERNELIPYQVRENSNSLDGLSGLRSARRERGERLWVGDAKTWIRRHSHAVQMVLVAVVTCIVTILMVTGTDYGKAVFQLLNDY